MFKRCSGHFVDELIVTCCNKFAYAKSHMADGPMRWEERLREPGDTFCARLYYSGGGAKSGKDLMPVGAMSGTLRR